MSGEIKMSTWEERQLAKHTVVSYLTTRHGKKQLLDILSQTARLYRFFHDRAKYEEKQRKTTFKPIERTDLFDILTMWFNGTPPIPRSKEYTVIQKKCSLLAAPAKELNAMPRILAKYILNNHWDRIIDMSKKVPWPTIIKCFIANYSI